MESVILKNESLLSWQEVLISYFFFSFFFCTEFFGLPNDFHLLLNFQKKTSQNAKGT